MKSNDAVHYDTHFYEDQVKGSLSSARRVLPLVLEAIGPSSVVDVGCGVGTWLAICAALGVGRILGLDGDYIDKAALQISQEDFRATDLRTSFQIGATFDLALCLEVAEHLPAGSAELLVRSLASAAPHILFSAAIPGQGGTNHVNEQWQDYWRARFADVGYRPVDLVRPRVWGLPDVESWYQQNTILYSSASGLAQSPCLQSTDDCLSLNIVHPDTFDRVRDHGHQYFSKAARLLPALFVSAVSKKFRATSF